MPAVGSERGPGAPSAVKTAPSLLTAAFARLGEQLREAEDAGADYIHLDTARVAACTGTQGNR